MPPKEELWGLIKKCCDEVSSYGVFNLLFSDSEFLYLYCTTKLHWLTRRAPFKKATLKDSDVTIDFKKETTENDVVTIIATEPLTTDEQWSQMNEKQFLVFKDGQVVFSG